MGGSPGDEPRALQTQGRCFTTKLHPQPLVFWRWGSHYEAQADLDLKSSCFHLSVLESQLCTHFLSSNISKHSPEEDFSDSQSTHKGGQMQTKAPRCRHHRWWHVYVLSPGKMENDGRPVTQCGEKASGAAFWQRLAASAKTQTHDAASPLHRTHPWKRQNKVRKVTRNNVLGAMTYNNKIQCPPTFDGYVNCHETERRTTTWIL